MEPLLGKLARQKSVRMIRSSERTMQKWFIRSAILAVLLAEICWALGYRNLANPASPETGRAIRFYRANPSEETKAAMLEQMQRDVSRNVRRNELYFALMLAADVAAIYFLWKFEAGKIASDTALASKSASHL
jgi:hypothetical protein